VLTELNTDLSVIGTLMCSVCACVHLIALEVQQLLAF
jgi:hypothetical protein